MANINHLIAKEIRGCFDFFWNCANSDLNSTGYGMVLDSTKNDVMASIAAVGFALPAYMIGVEHGFITREQGEERVLNTLHTIENNIAEINGFCVHFVDIKTGERFKQTEYSTIDTAIMLVGAITVGEYFGGEIKTIAKRLCDRVDWEWLVAERNGKPCFRMAYNPDRGGDYSPGEDGWIPNAWWDHYAEQLMMYMLYAGQENADPQLALELYTGFERQLGAYHGDNYVYSVGNALFIHQFTHAFFDFKQYVDYKGFDWFKNSVDATLANKATCEIELGLPEHCWGLTAMHDQNGYLVVGGNPKGHAKWSPDPITSRTAAVYGPLASMPFTPEESKAALQFVEDHVPAMWGEYGLYDSFDITSEPTWVSGSYLGIDKGPTIIMLDNYLNGTTWKYFMQSDYVQQAIKVLKFQPKA